MAFGEFLDQNEVPPHPGPSRYGFTAELGIDVFDVLQRPAASDGAILEFVRRKIYWSWRFKLKSAVLELSDATRLGVAVGDLVHVAFKHEGQFWTRTGEASFDPTPEFIRTIEGNTAESNAQAREGANDEHYDVALSFAGEQREYVQAVADALVGSGIRVFYDAFEDLWGADLTTRLEDVYRRRSRFVVVFVSKQYIEKAWPNLERQHALAGRIERRDDSVLPARFEPVELPGLPSTVGYLDISRMSPKDLATRISNKLARPDRR